LDITIFNGKINYKWPFSIAMLNYQRVMGFFMGIAWAYHALIMFNNDECGTANHKLPFGDGL